MRAYTYPGLIISPTQKSRLSSVIDQSLEDKFYFISFCLSLLSRVTSQQQNFEPSLRNSLVDYIPHARLIPTFIILLRALQSASSIMTPTPFLINRIFLHEVYNSPMTNFPTPFSQLYKTSYGFHYLYRKIVDCT